MGKNKMIIVNSIVGLTSQIIILILGFLVPKIILNNYGSDTNGVTNTITQIFTYIALLQAGIGTATQNALYSLLKNNNKDGISEIMSISRKYYRKISIVYACAVVAVGMILPIVLKTELSYFTIFFYVFFEGLTSLVGFYFTGLWITFLNTSGKTYFTNLVSLLSKILQYIVKIVLALFSVNILYIQVGYFFVSLVSLIIYSTYMKKNYGWIDYNHYGDNGKLKDRNSYVISEISGAIFSSTDMIVLSIMVSTALSSVYSVYNMIFSAIYGLINSLYSSIKYMLGHTYSTNLEKYKKLHNGFNSVFLGLCTICMCVCMWLSIPFVKLYTSGVEDINYIYNWLPFWFALVQMLSTSRMASGNLMGIAGYAKQGSYSSLIEASINVISTIILVYFWGIYGAIIGTVISLPVKVIHTFYVSEKKVMKRSPIKTLLILFVNFMIFGITVAISYNYKLTLNNYWEFILWGSVLSLIYSLIVFGLNAFVNKDLLMIPKAIKKRKLNL